MWKSLEERNLAIIETVMNELGVSDIEELPAKVIELKEAAEHTLAPDGFAGFEASGKCSKCGNEISIILSAPSRN